MYFDNGVVMIRWLNCDNLISILTSTICAPFSAQTDPSVDMIQASLVPVMRRFVGGEDGPCIKCLRRGLKPGGGGKVLFTSPVKRSLTAFQVSDRRKEVVEDREERERFKGQVGEKVRHSLSPFSSHLHLISSESLEYLSPLPLCLSMLLTSYLSILHPAFSFSQIIPV